MVMCVSFITPCTLGIPHESLNSNITSSIFCPTSHVIRLLNMMFLTLTISWKTNLNVDLPIENHSLHVNRFEPWKSLWITQTTLTSTRIANWYFISFYVVNGLNLFTILNNISFNILKFSTHHWSSYSVNKNMNN
jgi:hypothetical protein